MNNTLYKIIAFAFIMCMCIVFCTPAGAQNIPTDLSAVQVDQLSDQQITQLVQRANMQGMSDSQVIQAAERRGLPPTEAQKLASRINDIRKKQGLDTGSYKIDTSQSRRKLNYKPDTDSLQKSQAHQDYLFSKLVPKVFGSDVFKNGNTTFAPNIKIATPVNYIVGPEDQLNISVYGNSVANWKLNVSPEGNINIPGVGLLNVSGKTIEQASALIKNKLARSNYAIGKGTSVQVTLGNIRSIKVIMIGELQKPGTYTLPSLATAFNALYAAGGPSDNGSYRQIEIIRNNAIIRHLDIYDFLVKGDQKDNITLQDQDIIRVPTYKVRVEMSGEVKIPALFEVLPGETLADVINFAGGFANEAYTARVKVLQINDQQRRITDVNQTDFKNYVPLRGDKYVVDKILERFENRVQIEGAVFRPGVYELDKGLTLSGLIAKAAGLKEDAFTARGNITRLNPDNSKAMISFDVKGILDKSKTDIPLQREDSVYIASIFDLRDKYTVDIKGEVRKPGRFVYADSMSVADLIIRAGGFAEGASAKRIEVSRRISNGDPLSKNGKVALVYSVNLNSKLSLDSALFVLHPYDIVSIYSLPGFEKQRTVKIEGEVLYPGYYTIQSKNEKISDILKRAGGLTASADPDGSSLKRKNMIILGVNKSKTDSAELAQERQLRMKHIMRAQRDSTDTLSEQRRNDFIGINMAEIIRKPGSSTDLILEDGDILRVPKQQQIVRINGEVLYPSAVVFERGKSFKDYILNAGGYSSDALRRGAYVVYPNGAVRGTRKVLFFNSHPRVKPGSEIYVPKKPYHRPITAGEVVGLTGGIASIAAIILGIISLHK